jgi:RNA polymerase sigma-70 factor (ECF subfamily)
MEDCMDRSELTLRLGGATHDERFSELVRTHSRFVFRVAYSVTRNVQDAEDITQETFWKLYRNGGWREAQDERAFLAKVAWRLAVSMAGRRRKGERVVDQASNQAGPEAEALENDRHSLVQRLVDALPDDLRRVIALSTVDELSSPQIAVILGIPEGTVRTRLMRAREVLKQKLATYAR